MSEEEKKAIERFKSKIKRADVDILKFSDVYTTLDIHNLRLLLNLIEKQETELKEKEKHIYQVNEMFIKSRKEVEKQEKIINDIKFIAYNNKPHITQEKIIEYFKKEVEKDVKN